MSCLRDAARQMRLNWRTLTFQQSVSVTILALYSALLVRLKRASLQAVLREISPT
jgi:hypothetical protein